MIKNLFFQGRKRTSQPMRIFAACETDLTVAHGPTAHLAGLAKAWARLGHEVLLTAPRGRLVGPSAPEGTASECFENLAGGPEFWTGVKISPIAAPSMRLLGQGFYHWQLKRHLLRSAKKNGPPDILFTHAGFYLIGAVQAFEAWHKFGCRHAVQYNGNLPEYFQRVPRSFFVRKTILEIERRLCRRAHAVFTVSDEHRAALTQRIAGIAERVFVAENGADADRFRPLPAEQTRSFRERLGLPEDAPIAGYLGVFESFYRLDLLLRMWPMVLSVVPTARLILAGFGSQESALRQLAGRLGVEASVMFAGPAAMRDVPAWLNIFDAALLPLSASAVPVKLYEYLACGRPVVAADTPLCRRYEKSGALRFADLSDPAVWAREVSALLTRPALRRELGQAGREWVLAGHSWRHAAENILRITMNAPPLQEGR